MVNTTKGLKRKLKMIYYLINYSYQNLPLVILNILTSVIYIFQNMFMYQLSMTQNMTNNYAKMAPAGAPLDSLFLLALSAHLWAPWAQLGLPLASLGLPRMPKGIPNLPWMGPDCLHAFKDDQHCRMVLMVFHSWSLLVPDCSR